MYGDVPIRCVFPRIARPLFRVRIEKTRGHYFVEVFCEPRYRAQKEKMATPLPAEAPLTAEERKGVAEREVQALVDSIVAEYRTRVEPLPVTRPRPLHMRCEMSADACNWLSWRELQQVFAETKHRLDEAHVPMGCVLLDVEENTSSLCESAAACHPGGAPKYAFTALHRKPLPKQHVAYRQRHESIGHLA